MAELNLTPELVASVEWLHPTALGHVALQVNLLAEEPAPIQEVVARWSQRLDEAVRAVLERALTGPRQQAQALLELLVDGLEGTQADEWPAVLVLRPAGRGDELQLRVQAYLVPEADRPT